MDPDHATRHLGRVRFDLELAQLASVSRLRRSIDAIAFNVEFPAVIDAAKATLFIASEVQPGTPVRAIGIDDADSPRRVLECDQILPQKPEANRCSIRLGDLFLEQRRQPKPPK